MRARSFQNEIILMQLSFQTIGARDMAVNSLLMLRRRGYAHWLLMMDSERHCDEAAEYFSGDSGCIHYNRHMQPYSTGRTRHGPPAEAH